MNKNTGVTAPLGFRASGVHAGVKPGTVKPDLALILADVDCNAAAVFTTNIVQAAPIKISKVHLLNKKARAIIINSGNANACAPNGEVNALRVCKALSSAANIDVGDIIINSTGVIGQALPVEKIENAIPALFEGLSENGGDDAAGAIMTTDTVKKQVDITREIYGKKVTLGGMAKGSGMIHPNMATMLCAITTDCAISPEMLQNALNGAVNRSFNRVSVDGDTSTNDMVAALASGLAGNALINTHNDDYNIFCEMLDYCCLTLAKMIAKDGEGAKKLLTCQVSGAASEEDAIKLSKSVIMSSLVKTAMTGADANWGRILCAMGYAGAAFNPSDVNVAFRSQKGRVDVCKGGVGLPFDENLAKAILECDEIEIICDMAQGGCGYAAEAYGCDLTVDYVKINGDYRT